MLGNNRLRNAVLLQAIITPHFGLPASHPTTKDPTSHENDGSQGKTHPSSFISEGLTLRSGTLTEEDIGCVS